MRGINTGAKPMNILDAEDGLDWLPLPLRRMYLSSRQLRAPGVVTAERRRAISRVSSVSFHSPLSPVGLAVGKDWLAGMSLKTPCICD